MWGQGVGHLEMRHFITEADRIYWSLTGPQSNNGTVWFEGTFPLYIEDHSGHDFLVSDFSNEYKTILFKKQRDLNYIYVGYVIMI